MGLFPIKKPKNAASRLQERTKAAKLKSDYHRELAKEAFDFVIERCEAVADCTDKHDREYWGGFRYAGCDEVNSDVAEEVRRELVKLLKDEGLTIMSHSVREVQVRW